jgi:glycosyltransferase involved in cell wall biosynthesis
MARWSRVFAPVPVLVDSIHTSSTGSFGRRIGYRLSSGLPDRVCAVSQSAADAYLSARMVSASGLMVLPNGVDTDFWRLDTSKESLRESLGLTNHFVWFSAGRLDAVKDYPALLSAMAEIPEPACLFIAGEGPMEGELRRLANGPGLEGRVHFLGFQADIRPWMQAADAFVLSSRWEGLPLSLLEAGACGVPAVATAVAGSRDVLIDCQTGFLAAPGSCLALREAMIRMMRLSPRERAVMGENGRRRTLEQFALSSILDRWEALYGELLSRNPLSVRLRARDSRA